MLPFLRRLNDAPWFQNFVTVVILIAGVVVGLETYPELIASHGHILHVVNQAVLIIFVVEAVVKIGSTFPRPYRYFMDPWNVFDFAIVAVSFLPIGSEYLAVLRLVRLLRVLRLVRALPKLQVLVGALLKSIPSMGYVALLLFLLFYVYSVAAVFLFGANDPVHFKSLPVAMVSLFRLVTGDAWTDVMYINMYGCEKFGYFDRMELCTASNGHPLLGALFFISFMLLGSMVILNLFIGVIMGGMEEARVETEQAERALHEKKLGAPTIGDDMAQILDRVRDLQLELQNLSHRLERQVEEQERAKGDD